MAAECLVLQVVLVSMELMGTLMLEVRWVTKEVVKHSELDAS